MKLKLDENLGERCAAIFRGAGHDVCTVPDQQLEGSDDESLIEHCRGELRCLVTLDMGFANPLRFDPRRYSGIAVLRMPARPTWGHQTALCHTLIEALASNEINRHLWIVELGRVRIHGRGDLPDDT